MYLTLSCCLFVSLPFHLNLKSLAEQTFICQTLISVIRDCVIKKLQFTLRFLHLDIRVTQNTTTSYAHHIFSYFAVSEWTDDDHRKVI